MDGYADAAFNGSMMPEIRIENTRELRRRKKMKSLLSPLLIELIDQSLKENKQAILFRNRRGYAPLIVCKQCEWTPKCTRCDVTLTYHKKTNRLIVTIATAYILWRNMPSSIRRAETRGQERTVKRKFPGFFRILLWPG